MEWLTIYHDLLINLFSFLSFDLFVISFGKIKSSKRLNCARMVYLCELFIISLIPHIPFYSIINLILDYVYISYITKDTFASRLSTLIKYKIYYYFTGFVIIILHILITLDTFIYLENKTYASYSDIIDTFLVYITLCIYTLIKKLSEFPNGKVYKRYLLSMISILAILIIACSMLLGSNILPEKQVVPFILTLLLVVSVLCLGIYRKVITILQENAVAKIEIEKNALLQDYYIKTEENLKTLSTLRHDFKNHLIIIQSYASSGRNEELLEYLQPLYNNLTPTTLINTPSTAISSLLNAKSEDCREKGITFRFEQAFSKVNVDDFHLITILSNLLDNAITAASKCKDGYIELKIKENGSYLEFDCLNNHQEQLLRRNHIFLTTKTTHKELHGFGLMSVHKTVEKLRGEIHIDHTEDIFHVNILVPNYE